MSKLITYLLTIFTILFSNVSFVVAASGVLMKFTDHTRFYKIGTAEILSDLITEKLIASGKFHLKENYPIDISAERKLYEKNATEHDNAQNAMETGNLNTLFSGEGFNQNKASNIDTAVTGQIVQPELTRAIGEKCGVEYLIQGTIEGLGGYNTSDGTIGGIAYLVGGTVGEIFANSKTEKKFIGAYVSMRIIEASTGKVVWDKKIIGHSHVTVLKNEKVAIGNDKLQEETFHKALNEAAENIVKVMLHDQETKKFF
jgi:hypothetical protein